MIKIVKGNIFDTRAEALVVPVNCAGVMESGLSREAKDRWPANYRYYRKTCQYGGLQIGKALLFDTGMGPIRYIINMPTKASPKLRSDIKWIIKGLMGVKDCVKDKDIKSIAIPAVACGDGGIDWDSVREAVEYILDDDDVEIELYEPLENK